MFSEVAEIALVAARLGQFQQLLKTRVILILNFTRPHAITYTNSQASDIVISDKAWFSYVGKIPNERGFYFLPTIPDIADISDIRQRSIPDFPDHEFDGDWSPAI